MKFHYASSETCHEAPDTKPFVKRMYDSRDAIQHLDSMHTAFPLSDLDYCMRIDNFDFVMPITREDRKLVMRPIKPT